MLRYRGYKDKNFPGRMFQYYYRITDAYKKPVSTLVIFTDSDRDYKPSEYQTRQFGTELHFAFPVYKVIEQEADVSDICVILEVTPEYVQKVKDQLRNSAS